MRRSTSQADDEVLISRAVEGERDAFGQLYERYALRVFRHVYFLTGDVQLSEDITAQTFLNALEAMPRYQMRGAPFVAWLLRIASNLVINHRKSLKNNNSYLPETIEAEEAQYSPEKCTEAKVDSERVWEMVRRLPYDQRQVVVMRFIDGLGYPEIAIVLNKSIGAVRVIQFRALSNLRDMLRNQLNHAYRRRPRARAG
jgi:RNA polymerase sigma-70 factor (ECF subfamily)